MAVSNDPTLAAARKALGNKKYRQLVQEAHKRGFQVKSYLEGGPEALTARTTSSLRKEAGAAAAAAFKPAETQLTTALAREDAIQSKRARDLNDFSRWAIEQQSRFQQASLSAQGALLQQNQEILVTQGAAAAATKAALDAQLKGTGLAPQSQLPVGAATEASYKQQAGAGAQRAAGVIGQGIQSAVQQQATTTATLAGIQSESTMKGAERRQELVDKISVLAAEKASKATEYLSTLTGREQEKALQKYQTEAAAEIAGQKLTSQELRDKLNRKSRETVARENRDAAAARQAATQSAVDARAAATQGLSEARIRAAYGLSATEIQGMSKSQLESHMRQWNKRTGKKKTITPDQVQENTKAFGLAQRTAKRLRAEGLTEAEIRRALREGVDERRESGFVVEAGRAGLDRDTVNAALDLTYRQGLSDYNRKQLEEILGINTRGYGKPKKGKHKTPGKD